MAADRLLLLVATSLLLPVVNAFQQPIIGSRQRRVWLSLNAEPTDGNNFVLTKPLGLILEEVEEGKAAGVFVKTVNEDGSAGDHADALTGAPLLTVQGVDVSQWAFDAVMETIVNAPETVELSFGTAPLAVGTPVEIKVQQNNGSGDLILSAKVGDNLRDTLIEGGFEVYQGLGQKLGNCGGAGQCGFCAMDFLEMDGASWPSERSEYEDKKLRKYPMARLACLNTIQGPAVVRKAV